MSFNPSEPRDEGGKWTAGAGHAAVFKAFEDAPTNEGIEAAEENWRGGVADLGDPQAAIDVQSMKGYFDYRSHLEEAAREHLGDEFDVWRSMPRSQLEAWKNGEDIGPFGTTLNPDLAQKWKGLAAHKGDDPVVVKIKAAPGAIVMRGHEGESELVIDPNSLDASAVEEDHRKTPEFKKWFKNSKVVDGKGAPLRMYHGTRSDFSAFSTKFGPRFWASSDPGVGNTYATEEKWLGKEAPPMAEGANVMPIYLSLQNPLIVDARGKRYDKAMREWANGPREEGLEEQGYDGVLFRHGGNKSHPKPETIAYTWKPELIKSATGNKGTFDPESEVITDSARADAFDPSEPRDQGGKWTGGGGARGRAKTKWLTVNVAKRNSAGAAEPHDVAVNPTDDDIRDMLRDNPVDMLRAIKDEKGNVYVTAGDLLHAQMKNVLRREHGVVPSGEVSIIGQNEKHRPMMISGGDEYSDWIRADAFDPRADAKLKLALSLLDGISQYIRADWDESQHPRGQPENAGEFAKGGGGGGSAAKEPGGKWTPEDGTVTGEPHGPAPETKAAPAPEPGGGRGGGGQRTRSVDEAQAEAARAAGDARPLAGLPQKPIQLEPGRFYVPGPIKRLHDAADSYAEASGLPYHPIKTYAKLDKERATKIAQAYEEMEHDPHNPEVKAAYAAMAKETIAQWNAIKKTGLKVEWIKPGMDDPYAKSPRLAAMDVADNNHWWGFPTDLGFGSGTPEAEAAKQDNPLLEETGEVIDGRKVVVNDVFRIVHDLFGHFKEGVGFRAGGEENAWRAHSAMYSPLARRAMTSETRGQNSWVNYGPYGETNRTASGAETHFAPQKVGLMPEWVMNAGAADASVRADSFYNDVWDEVLADCRADSQRRQLKFADARADSYNPNEARIPKGQPGAGQWTSGGGGMGFTKGEPAEGDPEGTEVWQHAATGGKLTVKPNGAWYFDGGKGNAYEGYGGNEESLNKFINDNREIFKPSKPKPAVGTPADEKAQIVDAIHKLGEAKVKDLGVSGFWHTFMVGDHTDSANDYVFHVSEQTGEYSWKPPKTTEAIKGTGLHQFLDDMKGTRAFGDRAEQLIDALPKPPTEWTPNQAAWDVGGNEWNRKTGERLEKEFVAAAPELDAIVDKLYKGKEPVSGPAEEEDEDETATPTSWGELSSDQQTEAEEKWTSNNYDSFHESNVNSWYENGEALHSAKQDLADEGSDAPYVDATIDEFLNDWANDPDDPKPVPYTKAQLTAAISIEYDDDDYEGGKDPEIEFDDDELKNPTDLAYDPETQGVLPGMERPNAKDHFTQEMREDLQDRLVKAFNKQADKDQGDVEAPDYIDESTKEDLANYWDQMDDDSKFEQAKDSLDLEDSKPDKPKVETLDHPPRKYDPLSFNPHSDDYTRTRQLSHALSLERAVDVLTKRGLVKGSGKIVTNEGMIKQFTDAQATWNDKTTAKNLVTLMEAGTKPEDLDEKTGELVAYSYDMLYSAPVENVAYGGDWTTVKAGSGINPNDAEKATKLFAVKLVHAADLTGKQVGFNKDILNQELTPQEKEVFSKYEQKLKVDMAATLSRRVQRVQGMTRDPQVVKDTVRNIDSQMWREWVGSSTSFGGKMIQIGSSDEFGGHLRIPPGPKLEPEPITEATTADAIKGFGDRNSTENADLRNAIQAHLREETSKPAVLRKLPSDALKWNLIPAVVQDSLKLSLGKDGDVKVDFDTETMAPAALRAVEAIKLHLDRAIRRGIEQRREDMNVTRRVLAEEDAKLKFGGYKPTSEDAAIENMQALPSPNQMREAFAEALSFVGPTDSNVQYDLSKKLANNTFWRPAITKKDGKWIFDPAKLDVAGAVVTETFPPNKTESQYRDMLDEPTAREQLATAARKGFDEYKKWLDSNLRKDAEKVYADAKQEEWEPKEELIKQADQKYAEIGGYAGVKALMRAKWETTQWLMAKAGIHEFSAYRGILDPQVNDADIEKVPVKGSDGRDYVKLPGYTMLRNGAASTALKAGVSNNWHSWKGGDKDRVVLRIRMPRTAAISVPSYGQNNAAEREVIVTGTAWKNWDAYKQTAPEFDVIPIEHHAEAPEGEDTATTSEAPQLKEAA